MYSNLAFAIFVGCIGGLCAGIQCISLNIAMKYYNNLDVMPIYQSMILMLVMLSGLIILDESANYSFG